MRKYLFIDTETSGLPFDYEDSAENTNNWPRMVQCGYILSGEDRNIIEQGSMIIRPDGSHPSPKGKDFPADLIVNF